MTENKINTDHPLVTVVTVTFNGEKEIGRTIESVLAQFYDNIEYLIIDGKSKDRTVEIARGYEAKFAEKGVRYKIISEPDKGIYDAMNKGIGLAAGEIIGFINSGDRYLPRAVSRAAEAFVKNDFDYYYADIKLIRPNGSYIIKRSKDKAYVSSRHWNHPTSFVAKRVYKELGAFKCKGIHDDFEFFLRCKKNKKKIVVENIVLAEFATGGVSNEKSFKRSISRIKDRYSCYRDNGYSPFYIFECIAIEVAKAIIV